jgi:ATP-dependent helicase/nuclease subunit A
MSDARAIGREQAKAVAALKQAEASDPAASAWVSASAGTGKTKVLVDRVLRLLLEGARPERILCITFTKAAAAEMANRIDRELAHWATASDDALATILRDLAGRAADARHMDRARALFARVLEAPGGLSIQTIHAFCQTVLKRFPIEAGLAPHFAVIDERDAAAALADARRAAIEAALAAPESELARALAAVADFATDGGFAALLDALLQRPERLRAALAGGHAAFVARLHAALDLPAGETEQALIAAFCGADERRDGDLRRAARALLAGTEKSDQPAGRCLAGWLAADGPGRVAAYEAYTAIFFTQAGGVRARLATKTALAAWPELNRVLASEAARLGALRERCKAVRTAAATAALFKLGEAVLAHYERHKRARAALDFADLIARTRALLAGDGRAAWVLWKLDGGIEHVLVDEAQDTSPEQWDLVRRLVDEFFAGEGREGTAARTLFVVGDFKQSIFSFQGAEPQAFRDMHAYFRDRARDARRAWADVPLNVSFRSVPAVLEAVDCVFAIPAARAGVAEGDEAIEHLSARGALAGLVEVWPTVRPREEAEDEPWAAAEPADAMPEPPVRLAAEIADRIARWRREGEMLESLGRPIHAGDVMILVRRRGAFMDAMVSALKNRGIPVTGADRMRLGEQLAVQDLVALGRFLLLPEDDLALANVLKGPLFGFTDDEHLFPLAYGRTRSLWQSLREKATAHAAFAAARARLEELLARADFAPPYELYARMLEGEGGRRAMLARLGPDAEDPIDEFLELALDYQRRHAPSLEGFLHWLDQGETEIKRDLDQAGRDEVRVMTVHGAKGLQAPIVFLADTVALPPDDERILWPADGPDVPLFAPARADEVPAAAERRAALQRRQMEEYRRLLYVALTRAADRLYICGYETKRGVPDGCWYALVSQAFAALPRTQFTFDEHWTGEGWRLERHGRPDKPAEAPMPRRDSIEALPPWALAPPAPEAPPPRPLAPSRPAGEEPPVRSPLAPDDARHFRRGRLIHRLLQTLPDLAPSERAEAARRFLARRQHGLAADEAAAIAAETLLLFDDPAARALFGPDALAEVPLTGLVGDTAFSGQVDRLAITPEEILVIDYKTNRAPPRDAGATPPLYVAQMAAYRALLRAIYPGRRVRCFLMWTDGPILAELDAAALDAVTPRAHVLAKQG